MPVLDNFFFVRFPLFSCNCTFRDYLTVGPDPLTLDTTRLAQQGLDVQIVDQVCRASGPQQDLSAS
jgi:hypothetical protein